MADHPQDDSRGGTRLTASDDGVRSTIPRSNVRLVTYFAIGAAVLAALGFGLLAILSEEPPIKVRGGSLDIEIYSGGTQYWADGGNHWKLKSSGTNWSGKYNFTIERGNYCTSSGTPPPEVEEVTIDLKGKKVTIERHVSAFLKTRITPKGDFSIVSNNNKIVTNPKSGDVTITVKPGNGTAPEWSCTFPEDTFQLLCLHKAPSCS